MATDENKPLEVRTLKAETFESVIFALTIISMLGISIGTYFADYNILNISVATMIGIALTIGLVAISEELPKEVVELD